VSAFRTPGFWNRRKASLAARLLSPLGALYGAATARKMARAGERVAVPVICIGNFVLGGAGKTPTAIAIGKMLLQRGERVAFLSRGYGGEKRAAPLRVDPAMHGARAVGDEPLLLARVAPCYVGVDRVASARAAIEQGASVLIMDDGLQSPALAKDLRLAVVDADSGFGNGLCFPAGPLRAPVSGQARFVDAVIFVGGADDARLKTVAPGRPHFAAHLRPDAIAAAPLVGRSVLAFAGIARPEKFFATLEAIGARVAVRQGFADHHRYARRELESLVNEAEQRGLTLVTTEKDAVRIPAADRATIASLPVTLAFEEPKSLEKLIMAAISAQRAKAKS
jgi:tetraacyldisaccharide 4'-kinase